MMPRRHIWSITLLLGAAAPLAGLMYLANIADSRSATDLDLADHCVAWAHKTRDVRALDGPELATRCNQYFRVRSDKDADEDEHRWEARSAQGAQSPGQGVGSN